MTFLTSLPDLDLDLPLERDRDLLFLHRLLLDTFFGSPSLWGSSCDVIDAALRLALRLALLSARVSLLLLALCSGSTTVTGPRLSAAPLAPEVSLRLCAGVGLVISRASVVALLVALLTELTSVVAKVMLLTSLVTSSRSAPVSKS